MTSNRKGRRAETVRQKNVPTINLATALAGRSDAPAGRKGMQSQLRRCAGILLPPRIPAAIPADAELHGDDADPARTCWMLAALLLSRLSTWHCRR